jgi:hypothetical protein
MRSECFLKHPVVGYRVEEHCTQRRVR